MARIRDQCGPMLPEFSAFRDFVVGFDIELGGP